MRKIFRISALATAMLLATVSASAAVNMAESEDKVVNCERIIYRS